MINPMSTRCSVPNGSQVQQVERGAFSRQILFSGVGGDKSRAKRKSEYWTNVHQVDTNRTLNECECVNNHLLTNLSSHVIAYSLFPLALNSLKHLFKAFVFIFLSFEVLDFRRISKFHD